MHSDDVEDIGLYDLCIPIPLLEISMSSIRYLLFLTTVLRAHGEGTLGTDTTSYPISISLSRSSGRRYVPKTGAPVLTVDVEQEWDWSEGQSEECKHPKSESVNKISIKVRE